MLAGVKLQTHSLQFASVLRVSTRYATPRIATVTSSTWIGPSTSFAPCSLRTSRSSVSATAWPTSAVVSNNSGCSSSNKPCSTYDIASPCSSRHNHLGPTADSTAARIVGRRVGIVSFGVEAARVSSCLLLDGCIPGEGELPADPCPRARCLVENLGRSAGRPRSVDRGGQASPRGTRVESRSWTRAACVAARVAAKKRDTPRE